MAKKRKINLPLIEVIIISLVLHVAFLLLLGGFTIYTAMMPQATELEAPPEAEYIEPQRLEQQVRMQQQQQRSTRPRQQISVANPSMLNLPSMDIDMPVMDMRVAVGGGTGVGVGMGRDFGRGGIDFTRSAVNFFGIQSQGERIMFLIDAADYMLVDEKGGIPAYRLVKEELAEMVEGLAPGSLFNIMFFRGNTVQAFSPNQMVPATTANKKRVIDWFEPINRTYDARGELQNNVSIEREDIGIVKTDIRGWPRAIQISYEQGADVIFMLIGDWQSHRRTRTERELEIIRRETERAERDRDFIRRREEYQEASEKARAWLEEENKRRVARGMEKRVIVYWHNFVREITGVSRPTVAHGVPWGYSREEITNHIRTLGREIYRDRDYSWPPVNVVFFLGKDEDKASHIESFEQLVRVTRGRFRILEGLEGIQRLTQRVRDT